MSHSSNLEGNHGFLLMGRKNVFGIHLPMFSMPAHAFQVIFELSLDDKDKETYLETKKNNPEKPIIIFNKEISLEELVKQKSFQYDFHFSDSNGDPIGVPFIKDAKISVKKILFKSLDQIEEYPDNISYYLYGKDTEYHLSHILTKSPNFQQEIDITLSENIIQNMNKRNDPVSKISIPSLSEKNNQPIKNDPLTQSQYTIHMDDGTAGTISIESKYWINYEFLNMQTHNTHPH